MILALSTPDKTTTLRLFKSVGDTKPLGTLEWESGRALSDELLDRLAAFLAEHHAQLHDLTGIIMFSGPGSFTSLRIGHAVANALADSLGIPVVGATGDRWLEAGKKRLPQAKAGTPALPYYAAEANITKPKS
jgi:tRNA threonylcarbamoyladenosine biosynthesis protein TsaB